MMVLVGQKKLSKGVAGTVLQPIYLLPDGYLGKQSILLLCVYEAARKGCRKVLPSPINDLPSPLPLFFQIGDQEMLAKFVLYDTNNYRVSAAACHVVCEEREEGGSE